MHRLIYEVKYWLYWVFLNWAFEVCPLKESKTEFAEFLRDHASTFKVFRLMKELTSIQKYIFRKCLQRKPEWKNAPDLLKKIIKMADAHGDGYKRVTILGKGTYHVPIEDIICFGLKAEEVPLKYQRKN